MRITRVEIANFRSIRAAIKLEADDLNLVTLVGGNSSGKSNVLRAINLFFNKSIEPGVPFSPERDLHIDAPKKNCRISITLAFSSQQDKKITDVIDKTFPGEFTKYEVPITLVLYPNGGHQYSFTVGGGKKKNIPELLERVLEYINCVYIPAIKDYKTILNKQMLRQIVVLTFNGWARGRQATASIARQKEAFQKLLTELQSILNESGDIASEIIADAVASIERFSFSLPYDNLEEFLGTVFFEIKETQLSKTINLENVGSGVQSFTIFTMLKLLHELRPRNTYRNSTFLWLIEEPETFMHHDLQRITKNRLSEYSKEGKIFISSHSPVYVDKSNFQNSFLVENTGTTAIRPITVGNVLNVLSGNLGVSLNDFLPIKRFNILVEGETDRDILTKLYKQFKESDKDWEVDLDDLSYIVCGGAGSIPHFYNVYNVFNQYSDFLGLFDRDPAGIKARGDLLNKNINEEDLILIPESSFRPNNELEDIVGKIVWDNIIDELDSKGLVDVVTSKGVKKDYSFQEKNRVAVKKYFAERLTTISKKQPEHFHRYKRLLETIHQRICKLSAMK